MAHLTVEKPTSRRPSTIAAHIARSLASRALLAAATGIILVIFGTALTVGSYGHPDRDHPYLAGLTLLLGGGMCLAFAADLRGQARIYRTQVALLRAMEADLDQPRLRAIR